MNRRNGLRANSLRISISAIFRCIRFFRKSQDKKDGLLTIWHYAQRAAAAVGGVQAKLLKLFWTKSLPGESSASIVATCKKTTTNSNHCRRGLGRLFDNMHAMRGPTFTVLRSLSAPGRMTRFGMPPRHNYSGRGESIITFVCCGERKSSSGLELPKRLSQSWWS